MYNPRYFSMQELLTYPGRASPDYQTYVQQLLRRKRRKKRKEEKQGDKPYFYTPI